VVDQAAAGRAEGQPRMTSTDKTRGRPLAERVEVRVAELQQALTDADPADDRIRGDIELALATATSLTTGDVSHPSDAVGAQMNDWLERNKHIGIKASTPRPPRPAKDGASDAKETAAASDVDAADDVEDARAAAEAKPGKDDKDRVAKDAGKDAVKASPSG